MIMCLCTQWKMNFIFQLRYCTWHEVLSPSKDIKTMKGVDVIKRREGNR